MAAHLPATQSQGDMTTALLPTGVAGTRSPRITRPERLLLPRALVVLAGMPGAGKTTLLAKSTIHGAIKSLDSEHITEQFRRWLPERVPYRLIRPLVHLLHRLRLVWHCATFRGPVIVHIPATKRHERAALLALTRLTQRTPVLWWLRATVSEAEQGQQERGRALPNRAFRRRAHAAFEFDHRLARGDVARDWRETSVFNRDDVAGGLRLSVAAKEERAAVPLQWTVS